MTRLNLQRGLIGLGGVGAAAVAIVIAAAPAGATLVCPPGTSNPNYCTDVQPIAITGKASPVGAHGATLNGTSGPGVSGGDVTTYYFEWGESTTYGHQTATGTIGSCPSGGGAPARCSGVPAAQFVSADVGGLQPCHVYHFRIDSMNADSGGKPVPGADGSFTTSFAKPIKKPHTPKHVKHGHKFKVKFTLIYQASVKIFLRFHRHDVKSFDLGVQGPGKVSKRIKAPKRTGKYVVRIVARQACGKQTRDNTIKVR